MPTTYVSRELRTALHNTIEAYYLTTGNATERDHNHESMNLMLDMVEHDDSEELTLEGGIDCHFDGELRDQLLAAL